MIRAVKIMPQDWAKISEKAHLVVFGEQKRPELDRLDFSLMVEDEKGLPLTYATCKELDAETLYFQYGGAFPGTKGSGNTSNCFNSMIGWAVERYSRLSFYVENTNVPMLKLAMKHGFKITGVRNYKGTVLLEHLLEWK